MHRATGIVDTFVESTETSNSSTVEYNIYRLQMQYEWNDAYQTVKLSSVTKPNLSFYFQYNGTRCEKRFEEVGYSTEVLRKTSR